jgi:hypothetical protein
MRLLGPTVVTLDTWITGWRPRDLAAANFPTARQIPRQLPVRAPLHRQRQRSSIGGALLSQRLRQIPDLG